MKKLLIAIGFLFTAALAANAQDSTRYRRDPVPTDTTVQEQDTTSTQYRTEDPARDTTSLSTEGQQDMNQDTTKTAAEKQSSIDQSEDADRQEIAVAELPALIKEQLRSQDYNGWLVSGAFKKEKEGKTFYVVELQSGAETKKVKFDAQGNKLKEEDKDRDQ